MRIFKTILGITLVAIGLLWSLQGADLIQMKPVLCMANCKPLVGGSVTWFFVGVVAIVVGLVMLVPFKRISWRHP